ncbi:hypothetical protein DFR30_0750 [Thiogranum longum]|uniref:DUF4124 domain-containing protein n=1 Tax=Thiogranum longum TaxID=1537524 RepID=A0A4R1H8F1_9GAMM|nr:DUF4124 domain-containing protein [Thiogranum longum]TCK17518.1 hypothetical protein DFR30_0750 [Thiogranum longum]
MRIHHFPVFMVILAVVLFPVSTVRADIYRCVQANGHISYQQIRCHSEDRPIALKDRRSGWSPLRPGEQALLKQYRKKDAARRRKPMAERTEPAKESRACWARRKKLEAVRAKLRRGYNLGEGESLHRKRDNHREFLRQFCS